MAAFVVLALCGQVTLALLAQNSAPTPTNPGAADTAATNRIRPVYLSSGGADILKLSAAKVGDDVITAYIKSNGRTYQLSASEIVYLREQGVSDPVVTAMLTKPAIVATTAGQASPQPVQVEAQPALTESSTAAASSTGPQSAPTDVAAAPTYVTPPPTYVQPSTTVYVYPSPTYGYYNSAPYYGGYWAYPALPFGLGFGLGYYGGYHGGGYHGGGYYGGHYGGGGHH